MYIACLHTLQNWLVFLFWSWSQVYKTYAQVASQHANCTAFSDVGLHANRLLLQELLLKMQFNGLLESSVGNPSNSSNGFTAVQPFAITGGESWFTITKMHSFALHAQWLRFVTTALLTEKVVLTSRCSYSEVPVQSECRAWYLTALCLHVVSLQTEATVYAHIYSTWASHERQCLSTHSSLAISLKRHNVSVTD